MKSTVLGLAASFIMFQADAAFAQCASNASSCVTCHESQGQYPILQGDARWHVDHGFGDLCASCHGGDPESLEKLTAHIGLRNPLEDAFMSCAGCHKNADELLAIYASLERPTLHPPTQDGEETSADVDSKPGAMVNRILAIVIALFSIAIYLLVRWRPRQSLGALLRAREWNPYFSGALLGSVVAFSAVVCGRPLAASGAFDKLAAYPGRAFFGDAQYYTFVMTPGINWQVWMLFGLLLGSFAASKFAGEYGIRWLPDSQWKECFGPSRKVRFLLAFSGAVLVQIGAGIAGGCTSGLAISGGAVLAPGAFIFMAGMFLGGIPTAMLWYRGKS